MIQSILLTLIYLLGNSSTDKVLFNSNRIGNSEIYLFENGELVNLTRSDANEWAAVWITADSIEFLRELDKNIHRMSMNIITKKTYIIGQLKVCELDDKNISYKGRKALIPCNGKVFYQEAYRGELKCLNEQEDSQWLYLNWTHDGKGFCFTENNKIYLYDLENRSSELLVNSMFHEERGAFSPDGKYFVFNSNSGDKKDMDLFLMELETGLIRPLYEGPGNDLIAEWSADSESVYIGAEEDGNWDIYQVNLKGKAKKIIASDGFDGDPKVYYPQ